MPPTLTEPAAPVDAPAKPRLRGWLHLGATPVFLIAGLVLMVIAPTFALRAATAVYVLTAMILFGTSAAYHRGTWSPRTLALFRRADHANIFGFIAGTYTPLAVALLTGTSRVVLLTLVWAVALAGMAMRILWLGAPRWLYTVLYVLTGWLALFWLPAFWVSGGAAVVILLVIGGLVYSVGAVAYATKRPNPIPGWFGFHEVFHLCTILAAGTQFAAILIAVLVPR
ncbi:PAQR family membrane homeostasis protein TrhA [Propionicicella superfundia]|uniref:PAQR family membrane homeostasis protein TrhA n=1 Tax=Propionicicella superfundia TaxID=348582 RepID=UPI0003FC4F40|nr:hemolysin III family protein [Propionicicella superfundia]